MTEQEWRKRMTNPRYNELQITTHQDNKPYVFVSYKSDSWELVLTEIVYTLQKEYGLRVYFDKSFNDNNNVWTKQFRKNMSDPNCKAIIAFVDNEYYLSYATLLEIMYSQTALAVQGMQKDENKGLDVIPVNLETIKVPPLEVGKEDTGLGVRTFSNGTINVNADTEKKLFDETFDELVERKKFQEGSKPKFLYKHKDCEEEIALSKSVCWTIMKEMFSIIGVNENPYKPNMVEFYDSLVKTIQSIAPDVFDDVSALPLEKIQWNEFDKVRSFSYNGEFYNVVDAQHAYIAIVDVIHQNDAKVNPNNIVDCPLPAYVRFEDGTELSIPKSNYGHLLKDIAKEKVVLYADQCKKGKTVSKYEILTRSPEGHSEDTSNLFSDSLEHFAYYFSEFYDKKSAEWKKENGSGRMPSIDMEVAIDFECEYLDHYYIKEHSLKKIFNDIIIFFYRKSGNRYFDYIVDVCGKTGTKYPMIINDSFAGDKQKYSQIANSEYFYYDNYSPKEILTYIHKHLEMYFCFLKKEEGAIENSPNVIVNYKFADQKDAAMMRAIREKGYMAKSAAIDEMNIVSEVQGTDLKEISKYPSTKGGEGRVKVSYSWSSAEYGQYLSMRGKDKEFEPVEGNAIGIRAFYQFMLWFMVNKGVEIGSMVYGVDKNDVDRNGNNRGLKKWKDVLCVANLNEETKRLIGVETFPEKYATDEDGDLCVYVGGNLLKDNRVFVKMFSALETVHDISDYTLYFGGDKKKTDM